MLEYQRLAMHRAQIEQQIEREERQSA
jgi:hypothetical protein